MKLKYITIVLFQNDLYLLRCTNIVGICTDRTVALHYAVFNICVIANINIIQNDRIFDHTIISDINLFKQNRILYLSIDDTSTGDQTVVHFRSYIIFCRRQVLDLRYDRWIFIKEKFSRLPVQEIHICLEIRIYGCNIAPV